MTWTSMDQPTLISVAIVCLDAGKHLAQALESVLAQSAEACELVVIDGGSTDDTLEILRRYETHFSGRMRWVSEPDAGLYDAMNKALALVRGEYTVYLGADDRLVDGALDVVRRVIVADPRHPDIICGATRVVSERGGDSWTEGPESVVRRQLPQKAPSRHQSIYVRTDALRAVGGFRTRFSIAADYDLYLRLCASGLAEVLIDDVLSEFRLGGVSSRSGLVTAREYRDVRVAHGASPAIEQILMVKSALAAASFAAWRRLLVWGRAAR